MEAPDSVDSYVLCVDDGGYPESLEVRKLYAVLPDERARPRTPGLVQLSACLGPRNDSRRGEP